MNLELNIMIRPHWENDTISFIDYELNSPNITISSGDSRQSSKEVRRVQVPGRWLHARGFGPGFCR